MTATTATSPTVPNGEYTIVSPKTHRTFKVKTVLRGNLEGKQVLSMLTGPDNENSYTGFAFITPEGRVQVWGRYRGVGHWDALAATFAKLAIRGEAVEGYEVKLSKHCFRCNRLLTHPTSIETGIGPECAGRS